VKQLFIILPRVPYPLDKGDKLRAFNQIKVLSKNFSIHLFCLNDTRLHPDAAAVLKPFTTSFTVFNLSRFGILLNVLKAFFLGKPLQIGYFYSCKAAKQILKQKQELNPDYLYCQLIRTAAYGMDFDIPKTIDYQDVFSKGVERRIAISPWYLRQVLKIEYRRLLKYESAVFDKFDQKTIISEPDRDFIPHPERNKIHIIPNGVDFAYFKPVPSEKIYDLVFTGNMQYPPNVNSAIYLIDKIIPLLNNAGKKVRVLIAGASPSGQLLSRAGENIQISGWQDDIRDSYNQSRIFIAPMQIGTGLQNKLLEAMAMNLPCITSPLANAALKAKPGSEIIVCSEPEEYANAVINLLDNPTFADQIASAGHNFVLNNFNWEITNRELTRIIQNS